MTRLVFALAVALSLVPRARAQLPDPDGAHLVPEAPVWNIGYDFDDTPVVMRVFKEAFADDVVLRLHVTTSLIFTEEMIALKRDKRGFAITILHLGQDEALLRYSKGARTSFGHDTKPRNYRDVRPLRCAIDLPTPLANRVLAVWRGVLMQTRYDARWMRGTDGEDYSFWMLDQANGALAGRIWSPDDQTKPGMLVAVGEAMQGYCTKRDRTTLLALDHAVGVLEQRLNTGH